MHVKVQRFMSHPSWYPVLSLSQREKGRPDLIESVKHQCFVFASNVLSRFTNRARAEQRKQRNERVGQCSMGFPTPALKVWQGGQDKTCLSRYSIRNGTSNNIGSNELDKNKFTFVSESTWLMQSKNNCIESCLTNCEVRSQVRKVALVAVFDADHVRISCLTPMSNLFDLFISCHDTRHTHMLNHVLIAFSHSGCFVM